MTGTTALDRLYESLSAGNVDAAARCLTDDGVVWHCFDRIEQDKAAAIIAWQEFVANFAERAFVDVRQEATTNGLLREQTVRVRTADGRTIAWDCCIVVTLQGDLIQRLNEYIDRAGAYHPSA
jgi:ketosteroid isomerase-like protein